jgi:DNA-binding LacI/PurR family transcriptional regulator
MSSLTHTSSLTVPKRIRLTQPAHIGLVIDHLPGEPGALFTMQFCEHLVHAIRDHQVVLLRGGEQLRQAVGRNIKGVLAVGCSDNTVDLLQHLSQVPSVLVNRAAVCGMSAISIDGQRQVELAVEHFHRRGHRRIAMLLEQGDNWIAIQRTTGFVAAMKRCGLPCPNDCIVTLDHQPAYSVLHRLVAGPKPTAIFVAGECMAVEVLYVLRDVLKLSVPGDVSIIGLDMPAVSQFTEPAITAITQPIESVALAATGMLLAQIRNTAYEHEAVNIQSELVERASVRWLHIP